MPVPDRLLRTIVKRCDALRLDYYVTGSVASMYYGEPRTTTDVDIVIELPSWKVRDFLEAFPAPDFYADADAAKDAVQHGLMFNIIEPAAGMKADIIAHKDTPATNARLFRAKEVPLLDGVGVRITSPEDSILSKLEFYKTGGSDKHLRDIASILRISGEILDRAYLDHWALRLGVKDEWNAVLARVAESERQEREQGSV